MLSHNRKTLYCPFIHLIPFKQAHHAQTHTPGPRAGSGGAHMSRHKAPMSRHETLHTIAASMHDSGTIFLLLATRFTVAGGVTVEAYIADISLSFCAKNQANIAKYIAISM